jgi:hypothetical protein
MTNDSTVVDRPNARLNSLTEPGFNTTIDAATVDAVMPLSFTMLHEPCIYSYNILESTYSEAVF